MSDSFHKRLLALTRSLKREATQGLFNQYADHDAQLDGPQSAPRRCKNLRLYLEYFRQARFVLVGEAAGYNGCRFSGIPFTGENLLVGEEAFPWARSLAFQRSSAVSRESPFSLRLTVMPSWVSTQRAKTRLPRRKP